MYELEMNLNDVHNQAVQFLAQVHMQLEHNYAVYDMTSMQLFIFPTL